MGLWAASHNGLNQAPKATELTFDTLLKKNDLKAKVEDEVKSLIEDDTKTDNVDLTNGMSEDEAIDKYIAGLSDGEKNNLIKDLLGSAVDSVVNFFANNEGEETPDVDAIRDRKNNIDKNILDDYTFGTTGDSETVEDATKDTTMIGENEATTEDAEVDPTTAKILEYAELDDMALSSKLNAINSQLSNPELTDEEYNTLMNEKAVIEAAKTYKQEAKIIEKMTPEQQAELETINNEMIEISEKLAELLEKQLDNAQNGLELDENLQAEIDNLYGQLAPLQEQRQSLFDNAGLEVKTPEITEEPKLNLEGFGNKSAEELKSELEKQKYERPEYERQKEKQREIGKTLSEIGNATKGDTVSLEDLSSKNILNGYTYGTTDETDTKTLADKLREEATKGFSLFGTTTDTTTTTTSDKKDTTTKPTSNIFSKVASGVKSDDLEGVLDAMAKKGMSETFTNATKVGDNAGVDFTRRQFKNATAGAVANDQIESQEATDFQTKHMKKFNFNNRTLSR